MFNSELLVYQRLSMFHQWSQFPLMDELPREPNLHVHVGWEGNPAVGRWPVYPMKIVHCFYWWMMWPIVPNWWGFLPKYQLGMLNPGGFILRTMGKGCHKPHPFIGNVIGCFINMGLIHEVFGAWSIKKGDGTHEADWSMRNTGDFMEIYQRERSPSRMVTIRW